MLIRRYLAQEIMLALLATLLVLLGILFSQRLAMYLSEAANGVLSQDAILKLLALNMLKFATELLPLAFLIAALMALGRLYRDSEMSAMFALGISMNTLYKALLWIAIPLSILLLCLNFYIVPKSANIQHELQVKARSEARLNIFKAGVFKEILGGLHVVYIGKIIDEGNELQNIFLRSLEISGKTSITTAARGTQFIDPETGIRFLDLFDGTRYEIELGENLIDKKENMLYFKSMRVKMDKTDSIGDLRSDAIPTRELLRDNSPEASAELQRRLAGSISILILVLMIPALAHAKPREGRFNRLILGVVIYVIYFNLLGIGGAWLRRELLSPFLGLWWVHALMLSTGLGLRYLQNGRL